jgi:TonB family protein
MITKMKSQEIVHGLSFMLIFVGASLLLAGCAFFFPDGHSQIQVTLREPAPSPVFQPPPEYPPGLRRWDIPGNAVVDFMVDQNGNVQGAQSASSSDPQFAVAAVNAVEQWKYQPGLTSGPHALVRLQVLVEFTITPATHQATLWHDPPPWANPTYGHGGGNVSLNSRPDGVRVP